MSIKQSDFPVVINGKTYLLRFKHIALELLEGLGRSGEINGDLAALKYVFFAGLRKHHPAITLDECADILDDADDSEEANQDIMLAYFTATGRNPDIKKKIEEHRLKAAESNQEAATA